MVGKSISRGTRIRCSRRQTPRSNWPRSWPPLCRNTGKMSKHSNMKELRIVHHGDAYRVLFAFDERRVGNLLLGGRKADQKWYKDAVPKADKTFDKHLEALKKKK